MKSLVLESPGVLKLTDMQVPEPEPHERLLRVTHCAVCRTDAKMWSQGHRDLRLPRILGHEVCVVPSDSSGRFVVWPGTACGTCEYCRKGFENLCSAMEILGFHRHGGFAEYLAAPADSLVPVPPELPGAIACLAEPLACTLNALDRVGAAPGERLLIYGAGPVGLLMALAARSRGALPFLHEINAEKLARSHDFRGQIGAELHREDRPGDYDVAVNAAPAWETLGAGLRNLAAGGRFCVFSGFPAGDPVPAGLINEIHYRQLVVSGAYGCTRDQMREAVGILCAFREAAQRLIEDTIGLPRVADAFSSILSGMVLKFVVAM